MKKISKDTLKILVMIMGILISVSIFLPAMAFPDSDTSFSGIDLVFGTEFVNFGSWASGEILLSVLGILAYILPIAIVAVVLYSKKWYLYSLVLFVLSLVLLFLMPEYIKTTVTLLNTVTEIDVNWVISYGLYIAQVLAVLGVITSLISAVKLQK